MSTEADTSQAASLAHTGGTISPGVTIEDVHDLPRLRAMEDLQELVWGGDYRAVVPAHMLYIVGTSGGIVLGAYLNGQLVGFVLGLLAQRNGRLYHASHMLGIHPDHQGGGIGAALKWQQRERALAQGLDLMTWTFDPLEARNAHFNLHKLGVISRTYLENVYGEMADRLNQGLPSDRLYVEWWLQSTPKSQAGRARQEPAPTAEGMVTVLRNDGGTPVVRLDRVPGTPLSIEVPDAIQRVKREDPQLALRWRRAQRQALTWAFDHGYVVRDFVRGAYVLVPDDTDLQ
jgi:predicted GNAT superfamily acetyltransferase